MVTGEMTAVESPLDLTIIVPCFNEEANVSDTLDTVLAAMAELPWSYEILVIDDGSADRTSEVVEEYRATRSEAPIRLYRNAVNVGLTRTYVDGAFRGRGKYYRLVCGDNVEPRETIEAVFRDLGKADLIIPYHPPVPGKPPMPITRFDPDHSWEPVE